MTIILTILAVIIFTKISRIIAAKIWPEDWK